MAENEQSAEPPFRDALFRQKRKKGKWRVVEPPDPPLEGPVADTHAHLQLLSDPVLELARCAAHNVEFVCSIIGVVEDGSTTFDQLDTWLDEAGKLACEIAPNTADLTVPHMRLAVGCHPHSASSYTEEVEQTLRERLADPRVSILGEVGLDYHYDFSPRQDQREAFRKQIRLAQETGLPIALHLREAHDEAYKILTEEGFPEAGVLLHCFNLDWNALEPWVEADCYIALGGALTFKGGDELRAAVQHIPLNRLLTETDAPYMAPEPMRGVECGPAHVIFTAACLAEVRGYEPGDERAAFLQILMNNARELLDREPTAWQREAAAYVTREPKGASEL